MNALTEIDLGSTSYVCANMRSSDALEVLGTRPHGSSVVLAYEIVTTIRNNGRGRIAWHEGRPVAVLGFAEYWPGVWQVVLVATDQFREVAMPCLRWIRETATDLLTNHGGRRLQCDSRHDHTEAHSFLEALGARRESVLRAYGKDGADYVRFVWLAGENEQIITNRRAA